MLCDYIYADLAKAVSLYSQLTGGIVELREASTETTGQADNKRHYDFKVFRHDAGGSTEERSALREVRKPHHALFMELEAALSGGGYLVDLTRTNESLREPEVREKLRSALCVKVTGRAVIEDYARIREIASAFPEVSKLINRSAESTLRGSVAFKELQAQLEDAKRLVRTSSDRNERSRISAKVKSLEVAIEDAVKQASAVEGVEPWILDGLRTWIDTFLPGIINLRIYPSADRPSEHIFGHLKRDSFEDRDSSSFHFTYGSLPTEPLTMIGIITSVPIDEAEGFNPMLEFEKEDSTSSESVERAFRGMFRGFDGFEQMIRTCRYPRVLVQPLVVYRSVDPFAEPVFGGGPR
jgi:hypothetical protein